MHIQCSLYAINRAHPKLAYLTNLPRAKKEARNYSPDLIHVHYVAGNGLLGLVSKIHPMMSSVWGSDIDSNANSRLVNWIVKKENRAYFFRLPL